MSNLTNYTEEIFKCIRCGACRAVCPTFGEELSEVAVARGRMALVEAVMEGDLSLTDAFEKAVFNCAMCGACKAGCPSGVDVPAIMEAARAELVEKKRSEPLVRFLARKSLKDKKALDRAFSLMALGRAAYGPLAATPLARYLPYQYEDFKRNFPKIPKKPLSTRIPPVSRIRNAKGTVLFYAGCVINYINPEIGVAAVKVLNHAGYDVAFVKEELCCGKPLKSLGETEAFRSVAERNVALLTDAKADFIVSACPTCSLTLKDEYPKILAESPESDAADAAAGLGAKVRDINEFLLHETDFITKLSAAEMVITYHDPCHLSFGMGVKKEPRELLDAATLGGLVEMEEASRCCGFGGTFSFLNYELSGKIANRKVANIIKTGAPAVVTACPGCMMHLRDALGQADSDTATFHTLQIYEKAIKK
jgi:glycolate oxidase iron-sulfur subunit